MTELQAPLWLYGAGNYKMHVTADIPTLVELSVGGHLSDRQLVSGSAQLNLQLEGNTPTWQAVVVEASRPGLELDDIG
jgi:hypothetical protein